uniref:Endonuclease/exonuclease/phosphatase domain-containing protein n=1 Tax=viral metagenome TaxID=1070528 RepID=A0A6C0ECP1_9ZZZZ
MINELCNYNDENIDCCLNIDKKNSIRIVSDHRPVLLKLNDKIEIVTFNLGSESSADFYKRCDKKLIETSNDKKIADHNYKHDDRSDYQKTQQLKKIAEDAEKKYLFAAGEAVKTKYNNEVNPEYKLNLLIEYILKYNLTIICLQEIRNGELKYLSSKLETNYELISETINGGFKVVTIIKKKITSDSAIEKIDFDQNHIDKVKASFFSEINELYKADNYKDIKDVTDTEFELKKLDVYKPNFLIVKLENAEIIYIIINCKLPATDANRQNVKVNNTFHKAENHLIYIYFSIINLIIQMQKVHQKKIEIIILGDMNNKYFKMDDKDYKGNIKRLKDRIMLKQCMLNKLFFLYLTQNIEDIKKNLSYFSNDYIIKIEINNNTFIDKHKQDMLAYYVNKVSKQQSDVNLLNQIIDEHSIPKFDYLVYSHNYKLELKSDVIPIEPKSDDYKDYIIENQVNLQLFQQFVLTYKIILAEIKEKLKNTSPNLSNGEQFLIIVYYLFCIDQHLMENDKLKYNTEIFVKDTIIQKESDILNINQTITINFKIMNNQKIREIVKKELVNHDEEARLYAKLFQFYNKMKKDYPEKFPPNQSSMRLKYINMKNKYLLLKYN